MGKTDELITYINALAQPMCDALGIEVVEINVRPHHDVIDVQVFVDKPEGGIGMEACARFNRELAARLDSEGHLGDNYTLEVSSPGLDRVLTGYRDFRRVLGRDVQVFLKEHVNGKNEVSGLLQGVRESEIILKVCKGEIVLPISKIEKMKQIIN